MHFWRDGGTTYIALHDHGVMEDWCMKAIHRAFEKHDVQISLDSLSLISYCHEVEWNFFPFLRFPSHPKPLTKNTTSDEH
jgi:hypothetical protein